MLRHSLWNKVLFPRSLLKTVPSTAPIVCYTGRAYQKPLLEANVEHLVPRVEQVNVEEAVRLRDRRLVHRLQIRLRHESRQLLQQAVLLELVPQAPDHEELGIDPDRVADQSELLSGDDGGDLEVPSANEQSVQSRVAGLLVESRRVCVIVDDHQDLVELLHLELLARLGDLALLVDDPAQSGFIPVLEVHLLAVRRDLHDLLDVPLDGTPAVIDVDARTENDDSLETAAILLQNHADEGRALAGLARTDQHARHREPRDDGVLRLLDLVGRRWKEFDLAHSAAFTFE